MNQDYSIGEWAERAAGGALSAEEVSVLEGKKATDPAFEQEYEETYNLIISLNAAGQTRRYCAMLKDISVGNATTKRISLTKIISFPYLRTAAVAAGIALLTSTLTVWTMRHREPKVAAVGAIQDLRREVKSLKQNQQEQQKQIATIKDSKEVASGEVQLPASQYGGTGFALTNDGYLITSYHVTDGADSLYVQTRNGRNYKAQVVAFEPGADVAVLKIEKDGFRFGKGDLPYTFASGKASLGARIYSLGFPQDEIVYNEGYIASRNGYEGDSSQYRLEIAAGPGQSGAPVADEHGNIVAIIKSRDTQAEGTTYAVSSRALLRLLKSLPKGMKLNLPHTNHLAGLSREQQIEALQDYTCVVKVFGK